MNRDRLATEFGSYTDWMVDAVRALEIEDPVPAVCRGTGHPALLADLAAAIDAKPGLLVLDAGSGMGGPAAWLRRHYGCRTVGIDLMEQNVRAARTLFGEPASLVAGADALPFREGSFDAVWSVGVMEMIDDKLRALAEIARVLKRGGSIAVYTFTSRESGFVDGPELDSFVQPEAFADTAERAGLEVVDAAPRPVDAPLPDSWRAVRAAVLQEMRVRHEGDEGYARVRIELERFNRLRTSRRIDPWRFKLAKAAT